MTITPASMYHCYLGGLDRAAILSELSGFGFRSVFESRISPKHESLDHLPWARVLGVSFFGTLESFFSSRKSFFNSTDSGWGCIILTPTKSLWLSLEDCENLPFWFQRWAPEKGLMFFVEGFGSRVGTWSNVTWRHVVWKSQHSHHWSSGSMYLPL